MKSLLPNPFCMVGIERASIQVCNCAAFTGKNRPLDEEEVQFVDALEAARRQKEQSERRQELDALEAYQLVGSA